MIEEIANYIINNKEWLFSGIGILIPIYIKDFVLKIAERKFCSKDKIQNTNLLSEEENSILLFMLDGLFESLYKDMNKSEKNRYKGKIKEITRRIQVGRHKEIEEAKNLLKKYFKEIIKSNNKKVIQKMSEGLSILLLLTSETYDMDKYYDIIKKIHPDFKNNTKIYKIIKKYNVSYPVKNNKNIVLGRIEISHLNKIFNAMKQKKGVSVRFNISTRSHISKKPIRSKDNPIEWTCKPGYKILNQDGIESGNITSNNIPMSRKYKYSEIERMVVFINGKTGYRV